MNFSRVPCDLSRMKAMAALMKVKKKTTRPRIAGPTVSIISRS